MLSAGLISHSDLQRYMLYFVWSFCLFDSIVSLGIEPDNLAFDQLWRVFLLFSVALLSTRHIRRATACKKQHFYCRPEILSYIMRLFKKQGLCVLYLGPYI